MKLYLSSFDLGDHPEKLVELTGSGKRAVVIINALDNVSNSREKWLPDQIQKLNNLGYITEELDLRNYFGKPEELTKVLATKELVWVTGGNTFLLRRAMKYSGFDNAIINLINNDKIVYGGFSAGVVILYKDLHGLDITDDPNDITEGYDKEIIWDGLGLIDFAVAVHYQSNHSESELTQKEIIYYKEHHIPYKTLQDGEVIVINNDNIQLFN